MTRRFSFLRPVPDSLQLRVAVLTAIAVAVTALIVGGAAVTTVRFVLMHQLDQTLYGIADGLAATPGSTSTLDLSDNGQDLAGGATYAVIGPTGTVHAPASVTVTPGSAEQAVADRVRARSARSTTASNGDPYRMVAVALPEAGTALVVARPLAFQRAVLRLLAVASAVLGLMAMALAGLVGAAVARSSLRPVRALTAAVEAVARAEPPTPVQVYGDDELSRLAREFNQMVTSLERAREQQSRLIADAGHELRTPLTSLRTNIELIDLDQRTGMLDQQARQEMLDDVKEQLSEFALLITDLVQVTRYDRGGTTLMPVDLAAVLQSAVRRARRRGAGMVFDVDVQPFFVIGEPAPLERACTNLLDNAVKFSPPGGTVTVELTTEVATEPVPGTTAVLSRPGEAARIRVADQGPGIPAADEPMVFDRSFRSASTQDKPGTGLGLSIVAQAVARHGGWVRVGRAAEGGAEFVIRLPGSSTVDGLGAFEGATPGRV